MSDDVTALLEWTPAQVLNLVNRWSDADLVIAAAWLSRHGATVKAARGAARKDVPAQAREQAFGLAERITVCYRWNAVYAVEPAPYDVIPVHDGRTVRHLARVGLRRCRARVAAAVRGRGPHRRGTGEPRRRRGDQGAGRRVGADVR
jgi:hypothetical protein